jgi:hypothetical protein
MNVETFLNLPAVQQPKPNTTNRIIQNTVFQQVNSLQNEETNRGEIGQSINLLRSMSTVRRAKTARSKNAIFKLTIQYFFGDLAAVDAVFAIFNQSFQFLDSFLPGINQRDGGFFVFADFRNARFFVKRSLLVELVITESYVCIHLWGFHLPGVSGATVV